MPVYRVCIEETVAQEFELIATSSDEALRMACEEYRNGVYVLEPGNLISVDASVRTNDEPYRDWQNLL